MAVETTIQGKNVLVYQSGNALNFEFVGAHSAPESGPTLIETGTTAWYTVALLGSGGFQVEWDRAVNATPTAQDYDNNGNPVGGTFTVTSMTDSASFAATSLAQPTVTSNSQANTTTWTTQLPNDDNVVATFLPNGQSGGAPQLEVQQFDQKSNQVGASNFQTYQGLPGVGNTEIAALPGGGYAVTVTDNFSVGGEIGFELFGPNNNLIAANQGVAGTGGNGHIGGNALAALPDGGFVMAWIAPQTSTNSGQPSPNAVFTQEFSATGAAASQAQLLALSGAGVPQITVGPDGSYSISFINNAGNSQVVLFNENGTTVQAARFPGDVYTPAPSYTAPVGPFNINLVGTTAQTVSGGIDPNARIFSNDTASTLIGGPGSSTLTAGHQANVLTAGSGNADFVFPYLPWNAGQITNFVSGHDQIDVSQILTSQGYTGNDPFGDHTLTLTSDGHGGSDLWYNPPGAGSNGVWPLLITDIDNVAPGAFHTSTDFITGTSGGGGGGGTGGATITKLAQFSGSNGFNLSGQLISDAAGNLYGTAQTGQTGSASVYEIAKTASGFNSTPIVLVNFGSQNPAGTLFADSAGNLLGLASGGANNDGIVFEIAKTASGYAGTPTTIATFAGANGQLPDGGLIADASGNLFGSTTNGGPNNDGVVFEIAKTSGGYSSTINVLASFNGADGANPLSANLMFDASGNLIGTTAGGGANSDGAVFEVAKTASGYASTPTLIASFHGSDGQSPVAGLIADASGNLFGTTDGGGANGEGVIFEIAKTASGYAGTPTVLVSFNSFGGSAGPLLMDSSGDLWGTTSQGGTGAVPGGNGTVFELAKTASGYASSLTTIVNMGAAGQLPHGGLISDASGNLFGTTSGQGPQGGGPGSVYEVTGSGFVPATSGGGGGGGGGGGAGTGPTLTGDDSTPGQHLTANAPNATFIANHQSVVMTGDGGSNDYIINVLPWNAGQITDFNPASDVIDVSAILKTAGYGGTNPFGDHTLSLQSDGHGGTEVWYNPPGAGSNGVWPNALVDIDNVAASSLNTSTDFITNGSGTGGGGTGGGGTGGGAGTGPTLTGDDSTPGQQLTANAPNATFIANHESVVMTGDGGANDYVINVLPWNAGEITNFNTASDTIDVSSILQSQGYTGGNPFGDGTLSLMSDGHGGSELIYNPPGAGSNGTWPVRLVDVDHVTATQFQSSDWILHH